MNTRTLGLMAILFILMFVTASVLNDVRSESIAVKADKTCHELLKEAAKTVDGVIEAEWNEEEQKLNVIFNVTKTDIETIESAIAESGFSTPNYEPDDRIIRRTQRKCKVLPETESADGKLKRILTNTAK